MRLSATTRASPLPQAGPGRGPAGAGWTAPRPPRQRGRGPSYPWGRWRRGLGGRKRTIRRLLPVSAQAARPWRRQALHLLPPLLRRRRAARLKPPPPRAAAQLAAAGGRCGGRGSRRCDGPLRWEGGATAAAVCGWQRERALTGHRTLREDEVRASTSDGGGQREPAARPCTAPRGRPGSGASGDGRRLQTLAAPPVPRAASSVRHCSRP